MRDRLPALDGLRGVAVLAVIFHHWLPGAPILGNGRGGVDIFFALSGFLITTLLLEEQQERGRIDLRAFWMRRLIRLMPALLVLVAVVTGVALAVGDHTTAQAAPWALTYTMDFRICCTAQGGTFTLLDHTWSLAIEEQFYLVWPVFLYLTFRARLKWNPIWWLTGLGVLNVIYQFVLMASEGSQRAYFAPDSHAFGLLFGCAAAYWCREHRSDHTAKPGQLTSVLTGLVILACLNVQGLINRPLALILGVTSAFTALLICQIVTGAGGLSQRFLEIRWLRWVGVRSYGLYLYHYVLIAGGWWPHAGNALGWTALAIVKVGGSFAVAALSWTFLERPVQRRFRERWIRVAHSSQSVPV